MLGIVIFVAFMFSDQMINVIGVPLAAWQSVEAWSESATVSPYYQYIPYPIYLISENDFFSLYKSNHYFSGVVILYWFTKNIMKYKSVNNF